MCEDISYENMRFVEISYFPHAGMTSYQVSTS